MFKNNSSYKIKTLIALGAISTLMACRSYVLDDAQGDLKTAFIDGEFNYSADLLSKFGDKDVYKSKDQVLYNLEYGTVLHFAGMYDSSSVLFSNAENQIDNLYSKSISRGVASLLLSDNNLEYDGNEYENIYLNAFKALNYMHLKDYDGALVESRRIAYKMEQLDIRLNGLATVFEKADSTNIANIDLKKVNTQSSAMGRYLSTVLFAKTGKKDDARIEFDRLMRSVFEQDKIRRFYGPEIKDLQDLTDADSYNVLISAFTGISPQMREESFRLFLDDAYVKFSIPEMWLYDTQVNNIRVKANGEEYYIHMLEEMDTVALDVFDAKRPIIYARALARSVLKAAGTSKLTDAAEDKGEGWGILAWLFGFLFQEASEKADLRAWQTMPGQSWMHVINLPEGEHDVTLQYLDARDRVMFEETKTYNITGNTRLEVFESIYSY